MALVQLRLMWTFAGLVDLKGAHMDFFTASDPSASNLTAMAQAAADSWADAAGLHQFFAQDIVLREVHAFTWDAVQDPAGTPCVGETTPPFKRDQISVPQVVLSSQAGAVVGASLTPQVAFVVRFRTALAGPRFRGRIFLPPLPESGVDSEGFTPQSNADGIANSTALMADAVEASVPLLEITHVVWSSCLNETTAVATYSADRRVDTQRRRLPQVS